MGDTNHIITGKLPYLLKCLKPSVLASSSNWEFRDYCLDFIKLTILQAQKVLCFSPRS